MFLIKSLTMLGALNFSGDLSASGNTYLGAASGLVRLANWHVVVADDETHLGVFPIPHGIGKLYRISNGTLPKDAKLRKQAKKDYEALIQLPHSQSGSPSSTVDSTKLATLLAVPSGSTENREIASLIFLDQKAGNLALPPKPVDLSVLYGSLTKKFGLKKLNIEGAALQQNTLWLFQRGNNQAGSGVIELDYAILEKEIHQSGRATDQAIRGFWTIALGSLEGIPLGFSDATPLPDGKILFSASAEDTDKPEIDGRFAGSVLGILNPLTKKVDWISGAVTKDKVEGIAIDTLSQHSMSVSMVTDADDPKLASKMSVIELSVNRQPLER